MMTTHISEAYCLKCQAHRPVKEARIVVRKNGRASLTGTCPVCGKPVNRLLKKTQ